MEAAVANVTRPGAARARRRHRLLRRSARADARALRRDGVARGRRVGTRVRSGRSLDALSARTAPTSSRWCTPRRRPACSIRSRRCCAVARDARRADDRRRGDVARRHAARTGRWDVDVVLQLHAEGPRRAVGARADHVLRARARSARAPSRSFYLDLTLLEDYWVRRKYHHTISAPLVYALREALAVVEEEGLEARWARHQRNHLALAAGSTRWACRCCRRQRAAVDAERRARAGRRRRSGGAPAAARRVQHRDRRRPRSARRKDLARRTDGIRLHAGERAALSYRSERVLRNAGYRGGSPAQPWPPLKRVTPARIGPFRRLPARS